MDAGPPAGPRAGARPAAGYSGVGAGCGFESPAASGPEEAPFEATARVELAAAAVPMDPESIEDCGNAIGSAVIAAAARNKGACSS